MNTENQKLLGEWLQKLNQGMDFVIEQAPLVVQEYLRYSTIEAWLCIGIGVGILVFALGALATSIRIKDSARNGIKDLWSFTFVVCLTISIVVLCINMVNLLKITYMPRVVVIEWLRHMK